ncbi:MAG: NAD(P)-dependent oxidoreductase, partial [Bacteroidota bacterium]
MNILITGATGFIGSHIAHNLVESGHCVYATCRKESNFTKCLTFKSSVVWLNKDDKNWDLALDGIELDLLIHTAWGGVTASERNDWTLQLANFEFSKSMINLALRLNVKKIICLGSQAEYGLYDYKVTENHVPLPTDAYGAVKLLTLYYLQNIAPSQHIEWYWLRVFSILGENENESWLLSQVMKKLLAKEEIELTKGEQSYDYLYTSDFISALNQVIECKENFSGIYNICSGQPIRIKDLLLLLAQKLQVSPQLLHFG